MPAPRPGEALVSLDLERARIEQELQHTPDGRVPLPVAAAGAMHLVCRNTHDLIARSAYDDALNIAAVAISRLVPVFALTDPRQVEEVLSINVNRERFANGATELRRMDGRKITRLFIRRSDMLSALAFIKRTGNLFSL
jgi:formylmethanofuran:tetrahydromethanopterin formyltransferase